MLITIKIKIIYYLWLGWKKYEYGKLKFDVSKFAEIIVEKKFVLTEKVINFNLILIMNN